MLSNSGFFEMFNNWYKSKGLGIYKQDDIGVMENFVSENAKEIKG